jgi:serine protein kinase
MSYADQLISQVHRKVDTSQWKSLHWEGTFRSYLDMLWDKPEIARNAWQRLYDLMLSYGFDEYTEFKERRTRYRFFADPDGDGKDAVFGLEDPLMRLVDTIKAGAHGFGPERRIILLHGPVGSAKSTIARLMKRGLERYSRRPEGAIYTFSWVLEDGTLAPSPMNEDPLKLVPVDARVDIVRQLNERLDRTYRISMPGDLDPMSRWYFNHFLKRYEGDWTRVLDHVRVRRLLLSEKDRVGIGTFQPKDEKNQDSTELTGDINYRRIAEFGTDSDPRAFNFDGELNIANRGLIEFIEILKLDVAFLYDLLGATQEHSIKSKKFSQTDIDEVILGHTNAPEYKRLQNNELMEAFRDRTVKIDVPYNVTLRNEVEIYGRDFNDKTVHAKHIAPHTIEVAAMWAVLTRLEEPKKANLTLLQKAKLYNGKTLPGFTEDNVFELMKEARREGMEGISPRYIQDKLSNALVKDTGARCINPFIIMNELESGLDHHSLLTNAEVRTRYRELLAMVKQEYEDIVKNEVQRAISADEDAIKRLCANYLDNVKAHTQREKVRNPFTGEYQAPDERLMRSIEEKISVAESQKDDFRREIMNYIGALAVENKPFDYRSNERLHRALDLKLFEDQKDSIKLTSLLSNVVDKKTQEKIDVVKKRLIDNFGYTDESATDVLNYVASIFARGDAKS